METKSAENKRVTGKEIALAVLVWFLAALVLLCVLAALGVLLAWVWNNGVGSILMTQKMSMIAGIYTVAFLFIVAGILRVKFSTDILKNKKGAQSQGVTLHAESVIIISKDDANTLGLQSKPALVTSIPGGVNGPGTN